MRVVELARDQRGGSIRPGDTGRILDELSEGYVRVFWPARQCSTVELLADLRELGEQKGLELVVTLGKLLNIGPAKMTAEASTLELRPGIWPEWVIVLDERGDPTRFRRGSPIKRGDELAGFRYRCPEQVGRELVILND